jgi:hypothetical protein
MKDRRKFLKSTSLLVASAGVMGYHLTHSKSIVKKSNQTDKKSMMQHNVYFWLKDGVNDAEKKRFEKGLKELTAAVETIQKSEIGIPANTKDRDVVDHSFGYSLFVWFKNMEDHNVYQEHEAHQKFIADFSGLWARVQVYDSELI